MKILIIANNCPWASWLTKIQAIKDFYAPLVALDIDIQLTNFQDVPLARYPGLVTSFVNGVATDAPGTDTEVDQGWFKANIVPLIAGYDIAVFQAAGIPSQEGLPLGIKFAEYGSTWCCETFVNGEDDNYYLPGTAMSMGPNLGNSATVIIEHEIAHALYSITLQTDRTHEFFYSNQFSKVLTDIMLPVTPNPTVISLYQKLLILLQEELGLIQQQQSRSDPVPPVLPQVPQPALPAFPAMITKWASAIAKEEGAKPSLDNPGDLKLSDLTKSWGAIQGFAASDGGFLAKFPTMQMGDVALCDFLVLGCQDELLAFHAPVARTLAGFMQIFAGNPPQSYIDGVIATLDVEGDTQISTFLTAKVGLPTNA